ncbi:MAG TPA: murein biosynthesis integral membrane protein MurJ [Solirubrobacteraceae bacterium]|nr:murein biosynthesis integral membrane protein MurJ [Solirubrobacteraceae bacterium]
MSLPGEPPAAAEPPKPGQSQRGEPVRDAPEGAPEGAAAAGDGGSLAPADLPEEGIDRVASAQLTGSSPAPGPEEQRDGAAEGDTGAPAARGVARNTAIFSIGTGVSRVVGLLREIVFASYFGTSGEASAYTLASLVPNLVAQLFANAALSAAFVPVFTDLLQQGRRREAVRLASTLFWIMLIVLGAVSAFFILAAGTIMPLFIGPTFTPALVALTVGLSQVLFPVVLLLGLTGLLTGILQSYDEFTIPAISPAVWNLVIIVLLVVLAPHFHGEDKIYAYAIGILAATAVQMAMALGALGRIDFRLHFSIDWHDPRIKQVFMLMLPVTIGLGIVNLDQLINSAFGSLVSDEAPRAIDNAFRIYMLPQGMFSVAVATVLFPVLSRLAARHDAAGMRSTVGSGMRQINLLLIPSAAFMIVLATPITRLVFERGHFNAQSTALVSEALFWFAFSLPFAGINLLLTRTFFALQRPWIPTRLAAINIIVDVIVSVGLYKPLGIAGLVIGTVVANAVMTALQLHRLRIGFNGRLEGAQTTMVTARIAAASVLLGGVSWAVWYGLHAALGGSLPAQILSMAAAGTAGVWIYTRAVLAMHIPEAHEVNRMIRTRLGRA